jgi:hypothetical protein
MICPLLEGGYGTVKIYRGPWIFMTEESTNCPRRASTGLEARTRTG